MTHKQLMKHLNLLLRDLILVDNRLWKISNNLEIEQNTSFKALISEVEELIRIGEEHASGTEN